MQGESNRAALKVVARLAAALLVLDAALAFQNVWPTFAVRWKGELSIEVAIGVLAIVLATHWSGGVTRAGVRWLAALTTVLVIGHYADVTSQALFGRPINLYWDLRHLSAVGSMMAVVTRPWLVLLLGVAVVVVPLLVYLPARWAVNQVVQAALVPACRAMLGVASAAVIALFFILPPPTDYTTRPLDFAPPVTATYARQVRLLVDGLTGVSARSLPPQPDLASDLSRVAGADVLVMFLESYGASSWERPTAQTALAPARARLASDIRASGRQVVSAYVESPTFGGGSWLAHISFMSGIEVRDEDTNQRLMTQRRETFVSTFRRSGYRTIAVMPGMSQPWPEGSYYGFTDVFDYFRLEYRGPAFGWWDIPDQYSLFKLDALALTPASRPPVLAFFPTVTTHAPFVPTPPYQEDWGRFGSATPFDDAVLATAWDQHADWVNMEPAYLQSLEYAYRTVGGYLRHRHGRDLVVVLIGDHQPPALVTGPGASWDVPVHVIASRPGILEPLRRRGFRAGLTPGAPALMEMHELTRALLDAFGD